jgi:hypothetical protein
MEPHAMAGAAALTRNQEIAAASRIDFTSLPMTPLGGLFLSIVRLFQ